MGRKVCVQVSLCLIMGALLCIGGMGWRRHRLDRRVGHAIASLEQGSDAWINEELLTDIAGNPRYESEFRLFRGAWLLRRGETASVFPAIAGLRPEGRNREALLLVIGETYRRTGRIPRRSSTSAQKLPGPHRDSGSKRPGPQQRCHCCPCHRS